MTDDDVDLDALDAAEDPGVLLAAWPAVSAEVRRLREHVLVAEAALDAFMAESAEWRDATDSFSPGEAKGKVDAVSAEVRRLRSEAAEARDTIALLTEEVARYDAEHGVPDLVAALDAARLDAATCRSVAVECLAWDEAVRRAMQREQPSARIADLRARLASPADHAARVTAAVDRLVEAARRAALAGCDDDGLSAHRERVHNGALVIENAARAELLAVVGVGRG